MNAKVSLTKFGRAGLLAGAAVLFLASAALAEMPTANQIMRDVVTVGEKQVPLPQGRWIVAATGYDPLPDSAPPAAGVIAEAVLLQVNRGRVDAFVLIQTNAIPAPGDWGLARACTRPDIHHAVIHDFEPGTGGSCSFVNHVVMAAEPAVRSSSWETAMRFAAARGWAMPQAWLVAGFRLSDQEDALDIRYHFSPSLLTLPAPVTVPKAAPVDASSPAADWIRVRARGLRDALAPPPQRDPRWEENEWSPQRIAFDAPRQQAIAGLVRWSEAMRGPIELGMRKQITGMPAPAMPWVEDAAAVPPQVALRLQRLEEVRNAGAIPEERYRELRDLLLGGSSGALADTLPWELSLWKTVTWRALGSSLDLIISYIFTGSLGTAGGITVVGGAVNSAAYYGHELAWSLLGRGLPPPMRIVDFPTVGLDG